MGLNFPLVPAPPIFGSDHELVMELVLLGGVIIAVWFLSGWLVSYALIPLLEGRRLENMSQAKLGIAGLIFAATGLVFGAWTLFLILPAVGVYTLYLFVKIMQFVLHPFPRRDRHC